MRDGVHESISLHEHERARERANRGTAVAGDLAQDRHNSADHLAVAVDTLDEEAEVIDDLQLWLALAALLALCVHRGVVQRKDANAWADGKRAALHALAVRVPRGVGIFRDEPVRSLFRRPDHVAGFWRHAVAHRDQVRVAVRDVVAVVPASDAAGQIPWVVDAGRNLVLVVVLQHHKRKRIVHGPLGRDGGGGFLTPLGQIPRASDNDPHEGGYPNGLLQCVRQNRAFQSVRGNA